MIDGLNDRARDKKVSNYFNAYGASCSPYFACHDADGKPSMAVKAASDARVLALETPNEIVALVADYAGSLGNRVDVMITVPWPANVVEAESAREICRLGSGTSKVTVELGGHRSAVLVVRRASDQ